MSTNSPIEWTESTWNPVTGCNKISPGCQHCYAERMAKRLKAMGQNNYRNGFEITLQPQMLEVPLHWKKPQRIFVNSMSDLFHKDVPVEFIRKTFVVMALCPDHVFQVLTKRADWMREVLGAPDFAVMLAYVAGQMMMEARQSGDIKLADQLVERWNRLNRVVGDYSWYPLKNVWIGVSAEDQQRADERIPDLLKTPAAVRWVSYEPALGPIDFQHIALKSGPERHYERWTDALAGANFACDSSAAADVECSRLDWIVIGGESGPGARGFDLDWARGTVSACKDAGVPVFVKQLGAVPVMSEVDWRAMSPAPLLNYRNDKRALVATVPLKFRHPKGGEPSEWPADLDVREYPS